MKMGLLATLCIGVGWVVGVTLSMILVPLGGEINYDLADVFGNTLLFGFPGFILFVIAMILSLRDDAEGFN